MMSDFRQLQQQFINHIRDPQAHPEVDGIEDRRMKIYRELFFNNVLGFVSSGFPVLCSLFEQSRWQSLVRDFFVKHDCQSPYFIDISKEFLQWLSQQRESQADDLPFMVELAHYEWVELDISVRKEELNYRKLNTADVAAEALTISPTAWPLSYSYPVHQICEDFQPEEPTPGNVHLIVYRDEDEEVQFMQINAVTAVLLQLLTENPGATMEALVAAIAEILPQFSIEQLEAGAEEVLAKLAERGIVRALG